MDCGFKACTISEATALALTLLAPNTFLRGRGDGQQDDVVLILPRRRLALRRQHARHGERHILDDDHLARGIAVAKQVCATVSPSTATLAAASTSCVVKNWPDNMV